MQRSTREPQRARTRRHQSWRRTLALKELVLWWPAQLSFGVWVASIVLLGLGVLEDLMVALSSASLWALVSLIFYHHRVRGPKLFGATPRTPNRRAVTIGAVIGLLLGLGWVVLATR